MCIYPNPFIFRQGLRIANLIITPVVCGLLMAAVGKFKSRRGKEILRLDSFAYGFVFALSMALVRFLRQE
jgi:hypothetical protein